MINVNKNYQKFIIQVNWLWHVFFFWKQQKKLLLLKFKVEWIKSMCVFVCVGVSFEIHCFLFLSPLNTGWFLIWSSLSYYAMCVLHDLFVLIFVWKNEKSQKNEIKIDDMLKDSFVLFSFLQMNSGKPWILRNLI